jgi:hypothetical protein
MTTRWNQTEKQLYKYTPVVRSNYNVEIIVLRISCVSSTQLITVCFAALCCIMPVTFYLCWLASVNKKLHPTVVSGKWDFVLVLAALSGFLLVGGALLLTLVQSDTRFILRGNFGQLREGWGQNAVAWLLVAVGYLMLVVGTAALTLTNRSRWLSVYNVDATNAERVIDSALELSQIQNVIRYGNRWANGPGILEMVPFHGMSHVTIRMLSLSPVTRAEIEKQLRAELSTSSTPENGSAAWIGTLAGAGVLLNVCLVGLALFVLFFR